MIGVDDYSVAMSCVKTAVTVFVFVSLTESDATGAERDRRCRPRSFPQLDLGSAIVDRSG